MPSPVTAATPTQQLPPLTNGEGAVQSPDEPVPIDGPVNTLPTDRTLEERKQAAKAVLAESGAKVEANSQGRPAPTHGKGAPSTSHKRSRSGTPITKPTTELQLSRAQRRKAEIIERGNTDAVAMNDRRLYAEQILSEKRNEWTYYSQLNQHQKRDPAAVFGYGYLGYGNGLTHASARLQYPIHSKRPGNRRSRILRVSKQDIVAQSEQAEDLVPLRLDIEFDKIKLRDTFTWNLHDRVTPTEIFAETLVEDFQLPMELRMPLIQQINKELQEQLQDFYPHAYIEEEPLDPHLPYSAYKDDEMRILIKLNITIGQHTLVDQFEWDVNDPLNSPEEFARQMACDLSLSGEFTTAIAHSIREQCQMFTKSLYITGHPFDGRPVEDADIRDNVLPSPLPAVFRPMQSAKDYTPYLYELSEQELDRAELSILREQRRQKRSVNRRGGPALPDLKDRQRTVRTLVVSSVLPGAAETIEESHIFKVSRTSKRSGGRAGRADGGEDSSESDSDESMLESPAPSQIPGGTARTRGMRGAATAAQVAMRSAMGRSATPEVAALHVHETRTSSRQLRYEAREESASEPTTLVVKLRISSKRFHEHLQNSRAFAKPASTPTVPSTPAPIKNTPTANSMPPPPSPAMPPRSTPANGTPSVEVSPKPPSTPTPSSQSRQQWQHYPDGSVDAPYPLPSGFSAPPAPSWLRTALQELREKHPSDQFETTMRYNIIDEKTKATIKADQLNPNASLPAGYKAQYLPRIRCLDCPGKLYTAGPGLTVENFEVHLKNRQHRASVERRTGNSGAS
ncbi:SNF5-domain-containing protein [Polyplosphaeria fusca]|uniref:SNF5-domain-containing protein n=1 Tax=Polyplosphaeria fusca TaxID=682080 RepID=A0A9P4R594_9PLEO|nr:SNF5-domain-containing protein [Polyplosphaeria fusca]